MKNLFIEPMRFEKKADTQLTENMLMWPNEIVSALYNQIPFLANYPYSVAFNFRNDKLRSAKGTVTVGVLEIPFIIDNGMLKPLLVFYLQGQDLTSVMPLTGAVAEKFLSPKTFAKGLQEYKKEQKSNVNISGEYQVKAGSLLNLLDGTVYEEDKNRLISSLKTSPFTSTLVSKIENIKTAEKADLSTEIEDDIFYIFKNSDLGWTQYSGNSRFYKFAETPLKDVDVKEDSKLMQTCSKGDPITFLKQAEVSDVIDYNGSLYKMINLESNSQMFIDKSGNYLSNLEKRSEWQYSPETVEFEISDTISNGDNILVKAAENKYIGPISVQSFYKDMGAFRLVGSIGLEKVAVYEDKRFEKTISDTIKNIFYVPEFKFIKVGKKIDVVEPLSKLRKLSHTVSKVDNEYYLIGPEFKKYAEVSGKIGPYNKHTALWTLIQLGATEDSITKVANLARGEIKLTDYLESPRIFSNSVDSDRKAAASFIDSKFHGLIKEAASIADKDTLDVVLGLNLINEENLTELLNNSWILDNAMNLLSKLWLMSNIGLKSIDVGSLEIVLKKLSDIKDSLERLSYVLKVH